MLEICLNSISYRLLRSLVTVVIIVLAIAFLATIMTEGYVGRSIRDTVAGRTRSLSAFSRLLSNVSLTRTDEALVHMYADLAGDSVDFRNLVRWGEFSSPDEARSFLERSAAVDVYLEFFEGIPTGRRVLLVENQTGCDTFDWLTVAENFDRFAHRLEPMKSLQLPEGMDGLKAFLGSWPACRKRLSRIRDNYVATTERIAAFGGAEGIGARLLAASAAGKEEALFAEIEQLGFSVEKGEIPDIVDGVQYQRKVSWAFDLLRRPPVRNGWNREFQEKFSPGMALKSIHRTPGRLDWVEGVLRKESPDVVVDRDRFRAVAAEYVRRTGLLAAERRLVNRYGQSEGLSEKTRWLIGVSFLVCIVGIANAMLMSVLERFKEIATMKCLGARNQTIGFLFVTESTIIGVIGGLIGIVVGTAIVLLRLGAAYGGLMFERFPTGDMVRMFVACFSCSLLLTAMAAMYPALVASRMAPMEAMRVD